MHADLYICHQIHVVGEALGSCQHLPLKTCQLALALAYGPVFNLRKNLLQMFSPCLPPLLRPPHSDNSGFHGAGKGGDKER